ncbi:MAG: FG-GAP-like repeat-containing protein [Candidatus Zixiibacteriota bacterium]
MKKSFILISFVFLLVCLIGPEAYAIQYFNSYTGNYVGSYPYGIATADFNGDTYADLVTANYAAGTVSVLLGNGNGTFATHVDYSTGASQYPYFVDTGDMDGDGSIDIVTGGSMGIVIFYGVGDGTFGTAQVYYFAQAVLDVVVADFNNDTYPDIATSHAVRDSVGIHINNHDSTYSTHFVATANGTVSLAAGYLDSDNYIDLLVGCSEGRVWNLKNDQAGSFVATEVHIGNLSDPPTIAITDLNGDNIGDYGMAHAVNDFLYTYLNDGEGTYSIDHAYVVTDNPTSIHFADVDFDDDQDILLTIGTTNEIELYLNNGSNAFAYDSSYTVAGAPKDMVFADFDGDTYPDMAVTSYTTDEAAILFSRLSLILSVDDTDGAIPDEFSLEQNYPNPFNPATTIRFSLPQSSHVKVEIYNMLGQSVIVLADEFVTAGVKEVTWNGVSSSGEQVASGIYMYRITTDTFTDAKPMMLLK